MAVRYHIHPYVIALVRALCWLLQRIIRRTVVPRMMSTNLESDIRTPDQRLRVFVSSTLGELADERLAARRAIEQLRLSPIMFESGARAHPPRALYRSYLEQSDVFIGVYWQRYGWIAPDMEISGLEDEFRLSARMPRLIYVKRPAPEEEPRLRDMLEELEGEDSVSYKHFSDAAELERLVTDDLAILLTERFVGASREAPVSNLATAPQPTTPLIGRDDDVRAVERLLVQENRRLVTLTGTGGIGKTRLALAVLDVTRPHWTHGALFVDLTPIRDGSAVLSAVAAAADVRPEGAERSVDALARRIGSKRMLLVLDNFEHVADAAPAAAELLQLCPHVSILATSRVLLRIRGECEYSVVPLVLPPANARLADIERTSAIELFVQRAQDVRSTFALTAENAADVTELCRRLDGLPLALEIAAARARLLTPKQILDRLHEHLNAAAFADLPERQRTLTATLDWSYELLDRHAQAIFARLAALSGPFTLEAAEVVAAGGGIDVVEGLSTLVDHSLASPGERPDGEPAFRLLETVRTYAMAKLEVSAEYAETMNRLVSWSTSVLEFSGGRLFSSEQERVVALLDSETANITSAFEWLLSNERSPGRLLHLLPEVWVYWSLRGWLRSMPEPLEWIRTSPAGRAMTDEDWCYAYFLHGGRLFTMARYDDVVRTMPEQIERMEALGLRKLAALMLLATAASRAYSPDSPARAELRKMQSLVDENDYRRGYAMAHHSAIVLNDGDVDGARAASEKSLAIAESSGDPNLIAEARFQRAHAAIHEDDLDGALAHVHVATDIYRRLDHLEGKAYCLGCLAGIAAGRGDGNLAARLLGTAAAVREPIELWPWPATAETERRYEGRVRSALGARAFEDAYESGKRLSADEAIDVAFAQLRP